MLKKTSKTAICDCLAQELSTNYPEDWYNLIYGTPRIDDQAINQYVLRMNRYDFEALRQKALSMRSVKQKVSVITAGVMHILQVPHPFAIKPNYIGYGTRLKYLQHGHGGLSLILLFNGNRLQTLDFSEVVGMIGHEVWHAKQIESGIKWWQAYGKTVTKNTSPRSLPQEALYYVNTAVALICATQDNNLYMQQLVEAEAYRLGQKIDFVVGANVDAMVW